MCAAGFRERVTRQSDDAEATSVVTCERCRDQLSDRVLAEVGGQIGEGQAVAGFGGDPRQRLDGGEVTLTQRLRAGKMGVLWNGTRWPAMPF